MSIFLCVLFGFSGCYQSKRNPIEDFQKTLIQHATITASSTRPAVQINKTDDLKAILKTLMPYRRIQPTSPGMEQFEIVLAAAGNSTTIYCWPGPESIMFEIDNELYSGGNAKEFRRQIQRIVEESQTPLTP